MSQKEDNLVRIFESLIKFIGIISRIIWEGLKKIPYRRFEFWLVSLGLMTVIYFQTKKLAHLRLIFDLVPWKITGKFLLYTYREFSLWVHFSAVSLLVFHSVALILGLKPYWEFQKIQRGIDQLDLKNGLDTPPKLKKLRQLDSMRKELTIFCPGIGIERFEDKKNSLQTSLGVKVESFIEDYKSKGVKIILTERELPRFVSFKDSSSELKTDGDFLIGMSESGLRIESIKNLPHVLIAGSTGGGKSVFLKQMLLGLLKSTPRLQMYLIDLKGGLELIDFSPLPNVRIVKTEKEAVQLLKKVTQEMKDRFSYLEKNRLKQIVPERDKKDRIVVAIDESSVLYTKGSEDEWHSKLVFEARFLTDEIAKLSRAAGIHLILATQKVSKETVDTKVQENMSGKMCFKMNTIQGSVTILGSKDAHELSAIPGRGIWSMGSEMMEVQAPMLSEKELDEEILELQKLRKSSHQEMLEIIPKMVRPSINTVIEEVNHA